VSVTIEHYRSATPLVRPTRLTSTELGGNGKELSDGLVCNLAVGCTNGCPFCYVPEIHERFHAARFGLEDRKWGEYLLVRDDLEELVDSTNWSRWAGREVLMSSTHDPFLPELADHTAAVLEAGLAAGVRFRIQTRLVPPRGVLQLLWENADRVRLQVSIATWSGALARALEPNPNVPSPRARLDLVGEAAAWGIPTGAIVAPVVPACRQRPAPESDLRYMVLLLKWARVGRVYCEALHLRGHNLERLNGLLGTDWTRRDLLAWDRELGGLFEGFRTRHRMEGAYWPEHRNISTRS